MCDDAKQALTACFVDDVEGGPLQAAFAALRAPGRPTFHLRPRDDAYATVRAMSEAALRQVDRHAPHRNRAAASEAVLCTLLQAAIAAAKADRHVEPTDLADAAARLPDLGLSEPLSRFLQAEMVRPEMMDHITSHVATRDEMVDVYVVSRLAANAQAAAADHYLKMLASRLGLEQALTDAVETMMAGVSTDHENA